MGVLARVLLVNNVFCCGLTRHDHLNILSTRNHYHKQHNSLTLGIVAVVVGVLSLLVGWVPYLGLLAVPTAIIGVLLAGVGFVIALFKRCKGIGMPLLGAAICIAAFILPILSTGGTTAAISSAVDKSSKQITSEKTISGDVDAQAKASYMQAHVVLYDVESGYRDSVLYGKVPGVLFKLRNTGDRDLDEVKITVLFKDASGQVIHEENYHPVLVSSYSIGENKPLKAGYVWQMESGKFYAVKSVPSEWKEGSVEARVSEVKFAKILPILSTGGTTAAISNVVDNTSKQITSEKKISGDAEAQAKASYIQAHVVLYDVQARYVESVLYGKVPGVLFKLRNTGERDLDEVKVTVLLKDASGQVIHEESFHPVLVSTYSMGDNKPLKAGYIWQMESGKFYAEKSVPSEWKEGSVEARVSDVKFAKGHS